MADHGRNIPHYIESAAKRPESRAQCGDAKHSPRRPHIEVGHPGSQLVGRRVVLLDNILGRNPDGTAWPRMPMSDITTTREMARIATRVALNPRAAGFIAQKYLDLFAARVWIKRCQQLRNSARSSSPTW